MGFKVEHNVPELRGWLRRIARDQVPFAAKNALNRVAFEARQESMRTIERRFDLTAKGLARAAIRVEKAKKKDWPHTRSIVYLVEKFGFMAKHEEGLTRRARSGSRIAVPSPQVQTTTKGAVKATFRPRRIRDIRGSKVFEAGRTDYVVLPLEARRGAKPDGVYYFLVDRTRYRARQWFEPPIRTFVRKRYPPVFGEELRRALKSRR